MNYLAILVKFNLQHFFSHIGGWELTVEIHNDSSSVVLMGRNEQWKYMMIALVSYWWVGIISGNT